jgi:hypothetical protein
MTDTNPTDTTDTDAPTMTTDDDAPELHFADPDDYHRTRRLKQIHQAREAVRRRRDDFNASGNSKQQRIRLKRLAAAVAAYVDELLPLLDASDADDPLAPTDDDLGDDRNPHRVGVPDEWVSLHTYAAVRGSVPDDHPKASTFDTTSAAVPQAHIAVFRAANALLADLRPMIEEEETTEWEV